MSQSIGQLFRVELSVRSPNLDIDFDDVVGRAASFSLTDLLSGSTWEGLCSEIDLLRVDRRGLATYGLVLEPRAHLLTQRKNYRVFQYRSELDIAQQLLSEWGVAHRVLADPAAHKPRKFRVQYAESDFDFLKRMLEDAGISFHFDTSGETTTMVLDDEPQSREVDHAGVRFHDSPGVTDGRFATNLAVTQRVRAGSATLGDLDYRRASSHQPRLGCARGLPQELRLERFDYEPGAFLYVTGAGIDGTSSDDRGATRTDESTGARKVASRLLAQRQDARRVRFDSDLVDLRPGAIVNVVDHPHEAIDPTAGLLVTHALVEGSHDGEWRVHVDAVRTDVPFRPEASTVKPRVRSVESATVVGPDGEDIHTDEYARVRVHFHWDRESRRDSNSSCWVPTSQPWAGAGFGGVNLPRIGQEVLVSFLGGDPDRPVVIGRVFTETQPVPCPLPLAKNITGLISQSTPRLLIGASEGAEPMGDRALESAFAPGAGGHDHPFSATPPSTIRDHWRLNGNALLLDDTAGSELAYIQAQRDLNMLVKNAWTSVVGNYRACIVGTDDVLQVDNRQQVDVGVDQALEVVGEQQIRVGRNRTERVDMELGLKVDGDLELRSEGVMDWSAKDSISIESDVSIRLEVGDTSITLTEDSVILQSARVDLNPVRGDVAEAAYQAQLALAESLLPEFIAWAGQRDFVSPGPNDMGRRMPMYGSGAESQGAGRSWLHQQGVTDPLAQDAVIEQYYRRNSLDMQ